MKTAIIIACHFCFFKCMFLIAAHAQVSQGGTGKGALFVHERSAQNLRTVEVAEGCAAIVRVRAH